MICKVIDTIEKNGLLTDIKSVAVGVSGGADSMCLIHILSKLKDKYDITIKAVHVNHNLRGEEALRDENLVRAFCAENDIELMVFSEDISFLSKEMGMGEEECGRAVRYDCFEKACCDAVAVAHSLSDCVETFIYNLLRGTGIQGLCSIPVKREPNIIRPLLDCTREEIEKYCLNENVPYITDSTNFSDDYTRNYIRHNIIPSFERVNSGFVNNISHTISILKKDNSFIDKCSRCLLEESEVKDGYLLEPFIKADPAVRNRAVHRILSEKMIKEPEYKHIQLVGKIIEKGDGKVEIGADFYITVTGERIVFKNKPEASHMWQRYFKNNTVSTDYGKYIIVHSSENSTIDSDTFDGEKVCGELRLTSRFDGDRFYFKKRGVTKTLKKLFNEMKIPVSERNKILVLRDEYDIIWIEGIGVNGFYEPDRNTKLFCKIKRKCN